MPLRRLIRSAATAAVMSEPSRTAVTSGDLAHHLRRQDTATKVGGQPW